MFSEHGLKCTKNNSQAGLRLYFYDLTVGMFEEEVILTPTRLQRWSIFDGNAMPMFFSSSDAMLMVLATSYHRNRCDYF